MPKQRSPKEYLFNAAVNKAVSKAVTNLKKELQQYIDEQLNNRCNTTETVSSESVGMQTIIDDLRDELSETRTALDAVTLDRNQYKCIKELSECRLWDEQDKKDDLQARVKELTDANLELTQKVQHLTVRNEHLNKLFNYNSDASEDVQKDEVRYIVFERTNLSKCFKVNSIDAVINHVTNYELCGTYAFAYDRIKSQFEKADVAMFHDYYIVKL